MRKRRVLPSQEDLWQLLHYDQSTGKFFWKERPVSWFRDGKRTAALNAASWNGKYAGKEAFSSSFSLGYLGSCINGKTMYAHRVAWKMVYGYDPDIIDHINGDVKDNRISNLRSGTYLDNQRNLKRSKSNISGVTGVGWREERQKWHARITVCYRTKHIGCFDKFEDAVAARKAAEKRIGFHENHGRD